MTITTDIDIPPLTEAQLAAMKPLREVLPQAVPNKARITIRLDNVGLSDFVWCSKRTCRPRPTYGCRA